MTTDIRQSLSRLGQINPADLDASSAELTSLVTALRKEVETRTGVVNTADSIDPAYSAAASEGEQFLYVCAYQQVKSLAKLTLRGEVVWQKRAPMAAGGYAEGEDTRPEKIWGRDRFMPTNFAWLDDGGFLLADGYGSYRIHRYDKSGNWQASFGGPGNGQGRFDTPHGVWVDRRPGRKPAVVVADRAHHALQCLSLAGEYRETLEGFGLPANMDTWRDLMVVPELLGRVTILDGQNRVVARLGDDSNRIRNDKGFAIREDPKL